MDQTPSNVHATLQDSLDIASTHSSLNEHALNSTQLVSARSSTTARSRALETLERLITQVFGTPGSSPSVQEFLALQNTFECNGELALLTYLLQLTSHSSFTDHIMDLRSKSSPRCALATWALGWCATSQSYGIEA
jgi:hypothetical protein